MSKGANALGVPYRPQVTVQSLTRINFTDITGFCGIWRPSVAPNGADCERSFGVLWTGVEEWKELVGWRVKC